MIGGNVANQIVRLAIFGEIFFGIVDDMVCADGPDQVKIPSVCHRRAFSSRRLGNLHRECSNPATRTIDQYFLSGLAAAMVTDSRSARGPSDWACRGSVKRCISWLQRQ